MIQLLRTELFDEWLRALRDPVGKGRILARLKAVELGNFGDCASVGDGLSELRVHVGPGYRVYFCRRAKAVYLLLCAGAKSTQSEDIRIAKVLAKGLRDST